MPAGFGWSPTPAGQSDVQSRTHRHAACTRPRGGGSAAATGWLAGGLSALRAELDRIDDQLHALLMQRARVVERVAVSGKRTGVPSRTRGLDRPPDCCTVMAVSLPAQTLVRIWRELLAGTTAMQGPFAVAVCEANAGAGFTQAAREHFGALTPLHVHRSPAEVMAEVSGGAASVGVLPCPTETETPRNAWWTALLHNDEPRIHVVARLPFWTPRAEGAPTVQSMVIAAIAPDASERDRSPAGPGTGPRRKPSAADPGADRRRPDAVLGDPAARRGGGSCARFGRGRWLRHR